MSPKYLRFSVANPSVLVLASRHYYTDFSRGARFRVRDNFGGDCIVFFFLPPPPLNLWKGLNTAIFGLTTFLLAASPCAG
ncbi:unnamed protein product [Pylaiella littoralis]